MLNEDKARARHMIINPKRVEWRAGLGYRRWRAMIRGVSRYMMPRAQVPIVAILEGLVENGAWVV